MSLEQKSKQLPGDRTIYVSDVDFAISEGEVEKSFTRFGKVEQIQVKTIGKKKSLFIVFAEEKSALSALKAQEQIEIQGKTLRVNQYLEMATLEPEANIRISDLDQGFTELSLTQALSKYGRILSVKVNYDDRSKGIAYVQFHSKDDADKCIQDQANHKFKISKFTLSKPKPNERTTLYIKDIQSSKSLESMEVDLRAHLSAFGEIESLKVQHEQKGDKKPFAFAKFKTQEGAQKALKADQLFQGNKLLLNLVIPINDANYESNLFTKNLKSTVTEEQLLKVLSQTVPVDSVQIIQEKRVNPKDNTQKACIYLQTSEDGKKLITQALVIPEIFALYEKQTVYLSPFQKQSDRLEFQKMKTNQYHNAMSIKQMKNQPNVYQGPNDMMMQQPFYPQNQYPPRGPPRQYQQGFRASNYQNQQQYPQPQYQNQNGFANQYQQPQFQQGPQGPQGFGGYQQQNFNQPQFQQPQYRQNPNQQQQQQQFPPHFQSQQQVPQVKPLNVQELTELKKKSEEQVKQMIGQVLFPKVQELVGKEKASKFTGILLDFENFEVADMVKMTQDATLLKENIDQIQKELEEDGDNQD